MPVFFMIAMGAAAAMQGYGQYRQQRSQAAMADYNAEMAEYNAKVAENEALAQQQAIDAESKRLTKEQREVGAKQRASISARGGMSAGTDLLLIAEEAKTMQMDQLELMRQKTLAGMRGRSEATQARSQAELSRYQAGGLRSASKWTMATTGLNIASSGAQGYYMGKGL